MTSRQLRLLRAASASSIATLLAAVSHTLAGGSAPHPLLVLAVSAFLVPPAALMIGAAPSRLRVAVTVLVSQAAFHLLFQVLGAPVGGGVIGAAGHTHHLLPLGPVAVAALPDATMLLGHAAAAIVTVLLLWRGESTVRAIAGWVRAMLRRAAAAAPVLHERPAPLRAEVRPLADAVPIAAVCRRGPPVSA